MDLLRNVYELLTIKNNGVRRDLEEITRSSNLDIIQADCLRKNAEKDISCLMLEIGNFSLQNFEELLTLVNFLVKEIENLIKTHMMCILLKPVVVNQKKNLDEQMKKMKNEFAHQLQSRNFVNVESGWHLKAAELQNIENRIAARKQQIADSEKELFNRCLSNESKKRTIQRLRKELENYKKIVKKIAAKDYKDEINAAELNSKQLNEVLFARKWEHDTIYKEFEQFMQMKFNIDEIKIKIEALVDQNHQKENILKQESAESNRLTAQEKLLEENLKQKEALLNSEVTEVRYHNETLKDAIKQSVHQIERSADENKQLQFSSESIGSQIKIAERDFAAWKASLDNQSDESDDEFKDLEIEIHELQSKLAEVKKLISKSK